MRFSTGSRFLVVILSVILITSFVNIFSPTIIVQVDEHEVSLHKEPFRVAATFEPGDYPSGLTLVDGDVLNGTNGGIYSITGNFTIMFGATVTIVAGYKIGVIAGNIIIAGTLDGTGAGFSGGAGGTHHSDGSDGQCIPTSGAGSGGAYYNRGGGGGAYGNDGEIGGGTGGGAGGQEYGLLGFELPVPDFSDIRMGAGGGGGSGGDAASGGDGGAGGGGIYLEAKDNIKVNGAILCSGAAGQTASGFWGEIAPSGGGGGAGGGILLRGDSIIVSGELSAQGGSRGDGHPESFQSPPGGAGSGGRIKIVYRTFLNTTGSSISVAGGYSSTPLGTTHLFQLETTPPTISLLSPANGTVNSLSTSIHVNASDEFYLQRVEYRWDYGIYTILLINATSYNFTISIPVSDGPHVLEVLAQDLAGNWNLKVFTFTCDAYSPSITLISAVNNSIHKSGTKLDFAVSDTIGLSQVVYSWDGGPNVTFSEPYDLLLPSGDGLHNLTVYAQDIVGHWSTQVYSFVTDDTSPLITSPDDIIYTAGATGHNFTWTLTDSHPLSYIVTMNNTEVESGMWTSGLDVTIDVDGHSLGVYIYTITVLDELTNLYTDTVVVTVIEEAPTTAPVTTTTAMTTTTTSAITSATTTGLTTTTTTTATTTEPTSTSTESTTTTRTTTPPPGIDSMVIVVAGVGALGVMIVIVIVIMKRRS